ncbi:MAG: hypothetical protein IJ969_04715 [Anaerotignum sp.]|nr:hypothetical protein [Anaerotignum sp.]
MKKNLFMCMTVFLLSFVMAFSLAACGSGSKPASSEPDQQKVEEVVEDVYGTKTMAYFHKYLVGGAYTMESKYDMDGMEVTSYSAVDGNQMYSKTTMDGMESILILTEDAQYILDPASKMAIKMAIGADGSGLSTQEMFAEEEANYETAVSTGDMDVNGKTYFYEEFIVEDISVKYCFDGDDMKYILTEAEGMEIAMEIISMEKGADADLFVVPDGYEVMAF